MSNIAIILAGGVGSRMGANIPKQFIEVYEKPIIVYTLEVFENHSDIDKIFVVCHKDYVEYIKKLKNKFHISKLDDYVIIGGETAQASIFNAINHLCSFIDDDDTILFHESVRPMITEDIITDSIEKTKIYGNAMSSYNPYESFIFSTNGECSETTYPRHHLFGVMSPQSVRGDNLKYFAKKESNFEDDFVHSIYDCFARYNIKMYISKGNIKNMKLTTTDDLEYFKFYLYSKGRS